VLSFATLLARCLPCHRNMRHIQQYRERVKCTAINTFRPHRQVLGPHHTRYQYPHALVTYVNRLSDLQIGQNPSYKPSKDAFCGPHKSYDYNRRSFRSSSYIEDMILAPFASSMQRFSEFSSSLISAQDIPSCHSVLQKVHM